MDIKQWLEQKKQDIIDRNTVIQIETGDATIEAKIKDFNLVYLVNKKTGVPEFRLCGIKSVQVGTMFIGSILMPQYYDYYVDVFDNNAPLDDQKYNIGGAYYLTTIIPMSEIESKNYRLNREDLMNAFNETKEQVLRKEKIFK